MIVSSSAFRARHALFLLCTGGMLFLLLYPAPAMEAVREALRLCAQTIVPSLFPFLVFSALMVNLLPQSALNRLCAPVMAHIFHLSGNSAAVLALGFTGGYPVGVRTAAMLYRSGTLSRAEVLRLLAFCNNSGPGFLLGVVGIGVFGSTAVGLWLYLIHLLSALCVGILFRFFPQKNTQPHTQNRRSQQQSAPLSFPRLFTEAVTGAFQSVLSICAFVLFFMILLRMFAFTGALALLSTALSALLAPFGMTEHLTTALLAGLFELSTGSACLQGAALTPGTAALASFLLGWGGLSVHCQSLLFLQEAQLPCGTYFLGKGLQAFFAALLSLLLFPLL